MSPEGFPSRVNVYSYFAKWSAHDAEGVSDLKRAFKRCVGEARTRLQIIHTASVKLLLRRSQTGS